MLEEHFRDLRRSLLADCERARGLTSHLPTRFGVGQGVVVDSKQRRSNQQDVVVYDSTIPKLNLDIFDLFFVEGVAATIEVKSRLTKVELFTALDNARSVRDCELLTPRRTGAFSDFGDRWRQPLNVISAFDGPTLDTCVENLLRYGRERRIAASMLPFDTIVILSRGVIVPRIRSLFDVDDDRVWLLLTNEELSVMYLFLDIISDAQTRRVWAYDFTEYLQKCEVRTGGPLVPRCRSSILKC